jgi:hypothetical protein
MVFKSQLGCMAGSRAEFVIGIVLGKTKASDGNHWPIFDFAIY